MKLKITFFLALFLVTTKLIAETATIPVTSGATVTDLQTAMSDAVTAGNTDITLDFADGYTLGSTTSGSDVTLAVPAGVTKLTFYAAPTVETMPVLSINTLTYSDGSMTDGIVFDGVKLYTGTTNRYLIQPSSSNANYIPGKLTIRNCWIQGYRAVLYSTLATTTTEVNFYNNYFKNIANSGIISVTAGTITAINIRKNTFNNVGGDASGSTGTDYFIDFRSSNCVTSQINFSNNTIYYPRTQGRGLYRLGSSGVFTTGYIKENNNIYSTGNATSFTLQLLYTNTSGAISDADSTNYYSSKMALGSNKGAIVTTVYTENSPSNLFMNPSGDDFTITDPDFVGKSTAGDPRWFPKEVTAPVTLNTTVSPVNAGTVTPASGTVNSGTNVSLTATANFGYSFKEWRDANTNNLISTDNPYGFTISANTSLVAVFDVLTTYNFTLDYDGTGAQWGNVTLSPEPTNGKYVDGTEVTATVIPNSVTTFSKWDDNTTTSPKVITVNSDMNLTATFDVIPFITGWDFQIGEPRNSREGDYYAEDTNKGTLNIYNQDGNSTSWLSHPGWSNPSTPCALLWTSSTDFATNNRYWEATFSTLGYKNIEIKSQMSGSYQYYTNQKIQISLNGTDFTDLASVDLSGSWTDLNATLPQSYEGQSIVYVRWKANTSSAINGSGNDGTAITNIFVFADKIGTELISSTESNEYAYYSNNKLIVSNVEPTSIISVYSFNGMLLAKQTAVSNRTIFPVNTSCIVKITSNGRTSVLKAMK